MKNTTKKFISLISAASMAMAAMPAFAAPAVKLSGKGKDVAVSISDAGTQFYAAQIALTIGGDTYKLTTVEGDLGVLKNSESGSVLYVDSLDLREAKGDMKLGDIKAATDNIDFTGISDKAQVILVDRSFKPVKLADVDVIVPQKLDLSASLGWDGENFTIDFAYDGEARGEAIRVYAEGDEEGKYVEATITEGMDGAAFATVNTNRQYQAKGVAQGVESLNATEPVSVYSLVMEAVSQLSDTKITAEQLAKVNEVLKNGGIFIDSTGNLTEEAKLVMTKADNVLTLTPQAKTAGLKFTDGSKVVGSPDSFDTITVNEDGTATLTNSATANMAEVLSLDAVNLEFVPTEIDTAEADGGEASVDADEVL